MRQFAVRFVVICATVILIGCSADVGKTGNISGKVTVAGKGPLTGGNITFTPATAPDKAVSAPIGGDGTYKTSAVPYGELKVSVDNLFLKSMPPVAGGTASMGAAEVKYMKIDAKYAKPESSGLSTTLSSSSHNFDVEVKP
jgi:hypothetical protein